MPLLLSTILANRQKSNQPLVLLQSSIAQSALPILREFVNAQAEKSSTILLCALHNPSVILTEENLSRGNINVLDWTSYVPGYEDVDSDANLKLNLVKQATEKGMLKHFVREVRPGRQFGIQYFRVQ